MRFLNYWANRTFASPIFSFLLNQRFTDTLCGTVISKTHYNRIAAGREYFGEFDPFGDYDLIFGAAKLDLVTEVPIRYADRTYGEPQISRFRDGFCCCGWSSLHGETEGVVAHGSDSPLKDHRSVWDKPVLRAIYGDYHRYIFSALGEDGPILDIGAEAGIFVKCQIQIVSLDILPAPWVDVAGDAEALPSPMGVSRELRCSMCSSYRAR